MFEKQYRPIYVPITLGSDLAIYASALARPVIIELGIALRLGLAKARVIVRGWVFRAGDRLATGAS